MRNDVRANDIDWVFCWRAATGGVADPGQRVIRMNGKLVRPGPLPAIRGSGAIVCGRENSREQPRGPRLDQQGVVSRMAAFACPIIT